METTNVASVCRLITDRHASSVDMVMATAFTPDGKWSLAALANGQVMAFEESCFAEHSMSAASPALPLLPSAALTTFYPAGEFTHVDEALTSIRVVTRPLPPSTSASTLGAKLEQQGQQRSNASDSASPTGGGSAPTGAPTVSVYRVFATTSLGRVEVVDWTPRKSCVPVGSSKEWGNEIMACDISPDGATLVTGGSDAVVRVYTIPAAVTDTFPLTVSTKTGAAIDHGLLHDGSDDGGPTTTTREDSDTDDKTKSVEVKKSGTVDCRGIKLSRFYEQELDSHGQVSRGHTSKIMAVRFATPHQFLTAGWESSVLQFDLRSKQAVAERVLGGPRVCGDSLDVVDGTFVATVSQTNPQNSHVAPHRRISLSSSTGDSPDRPKQFHVFDLLSGLEVEPSDGPTEAVRVGAASVGFRKSTPVTPPAVSTTAPTSVQGARGDAVPHAPPGQRPMSSSGASMAFPPLSLEFLPYSMKTFGRKSRFGLWCCGKDKNSCVAVDVSSGKQTASAVGFDAPLTTVAVRPGDPSTVIVGGGHNAVWRISAPPVGAASGL